MVTSILTFLGASVSVSRYVLLVPGALIEGISASVIAGTLVRAGIYEFWLAYACLILGKLIGDITWYWVGYYVGRPFVEKAGKRFGVTDEDIEVAEDLFRRHQNGVLFFSKLTMGLGLSIVILFTAGLSRISFWRYMLLNFLGELIWTGALLMIGIFFGNLLITTSNGYGRALIIAAYVAGFALLIMGGRLVRTRVREARKERMRRAS